MLSTPPDGNAEHRGWLAATGLPELIRILGVAMHPAKIGLALAAIVATFFLGTALDWVWTRSGGVPGDAVAQFTLSCESGLPLPEEKGDRGVFSVWCEHQQRCILGFLGSSVPGTSFGTGAPIESLVQNRLGANPLHHLVSMAHGALWLVRCHPVFFILFAAGSLLIWSLCGGAICRLAAMQFTREEKLTMTQGLAFARSRLFGGFFLAPCIPLAFVALIAVLLTFGGVLLRVPWLGDLLSVFFILALLGGFAIVVLLLGLAVGGNLFWPVVAAEGSDAFDAFSRGLAYTFSRPWRTIWYFAFATVFASVCWLFAHFLVFSTLTITRGVMAWGTSPFGWWLRGEEGSKVSKLELLWPTVGGSMLHAWPDWSRLGYLERLSGLVIGLYVLLAVALLWAFLASFYFSASTVIYFLLRRDVDGADVGDVFVEGESAGIDSANPPGGARPLPIVTGGSSETPPPESGGAIPGS